MAIDIRNHTCVSTPYAVFPIILRRKRFTSVHISISNASLGCKQTFLSITLLHLMEMLLKAVVLVEEDGCAFQFDLGGAVFLIEAGRENAELDVEGVKLVEVQKSIAPAPRPCECARERYSIVVVLVLAFSCQGHIVVVKLTLVKQTFHCDGLGRAHLLVQV